MCNVAHLSLYVPCSEERTSHRVMATRKKYKNVSHKFVPVMMDRVLRWY